MKYEIGDRIAIINDGFHGEIIEINYTMGNWQYKIKWSDHIQLSNLTTHNASHIDNISNFDKQYYRDKQLNKLI